MRQQLLLTIITFCSFINGAMATNPIVTIETNYGDIILELYPDTAPITVANFLNYTNNQFYDGLIFHRVIYGFMNQAGHRDPNGIAPTPNPPIVNEFSISNTRGTIAMAKLSGDPNSATCQFFINTNDNSANLDFQNGGFTVFGRVIIGMDVVDTINMSPILSGDVPATNVIMESVYEGAPLDYPSLDDDNDGIANGRDAAPLDNFTCTNIDRDGCEDCISGTYDIRNDGPDANNNGICDTGEPLNANCYTATTLEDNIEITDFTTPANYFLWYEYTPQYDQATISLCGSNFDTRLAIVEQCTDQYALAVNDNACGLQSQLTTTLVPGQPYLIVAYGLNVNTGDITLNATSLPSATFCETPPLTDLTNDCLVNTDDLTTISNNWLQETSIGDLSGDGIVDLTDVALLTIEWQDCGYYNPNACP